MLHVLHIILKGDAILGKKIHYIISISCLNGRTLDHILLLEIKLFFF